MKPTSIQQACAFKVLIDQGWSTRKISRALAVSQPSVVRSLSLLRLHEYVQAAVENGNLSPGTGYELSKIEDHRLQLAAGVLIVKHGLSRTEAINHVNNPPFPPRTFRLYRGRVVVKPMWVGTSEEVLEMLREAVSIVEGQLGIKTQAAA